MKKSILIIALLSVSVLISNCKKKDKINPKQDIVCIWSIDMNNSKTFYRCATLEESSKILIKMRDDGIQSESVRKSTCSECN